MVVVVVVVVAAVAAAATFCLVMCTASSFWYVRKPKDCGDFSYNCEAHHKRAPVTFKTLDKRSTGKSDLHAISYDNLCKSVRAKIRSTATPKVGFIGWVQNPSEVSHPRLK